MGPARLLAGRYYYNVLFPGRGSPVTVPEGDLEKVTPIESIRQLLIDGRFGNKDTFLRLITFERLRQPLQDTLYSLRASRTEFQPHQFKPLLKFLRSPKQRLLLADEVGLGKTIEAGFILCEMLARHPHTFRRILIVCKASLCGKWQMELKTRFDLEFQIWKAPQLRSFLKEYMHEEDPALRAICSLESFRSVVLDPEWQAASPHLNLLIIDEAHHLKNADTQSHKACRSAAEMADAVLALTATPIQVNSRDLFNLLSLLDPDEFSSFEYFQACMWYNRQIVDAERRITTTDPDRFSRIREILLRLVEARWSGVSFYLALLAEGIKPSKDLGAAGRAVAESIRRHPLFTETLRLLDTADPQDRRATVAIQRNLAELNLLSRILSRTRRRDVYLGSKREAHVKLVHMTEAELGFYRAVLKYVGDRYVREGKDPALLFGLMMPQRQMASCIPAMVEFYETEAAIVGGLDQELSDVDPDDWNSGQASSRLVAAEELREVIRKWYSVGQPDTKFDVLHECLRELETVQPGERIVIFSYFKRTLRYLERRLRSLGYSCTVISGDFSPEERDSRINEFRQGTYRILLSSEVGSEGLDLQFCHILFNYDLPWNPMVVEQRIGRLDRIGQKAEKILIFNLSAPGTIEHEILQRLYNRIRLFESYIGDLEAILGDEINMLTRDLFDPSLSDKDRAERIERAGRVLERKKLEIEELEKASAQFIGQDEFYYQEVEDIQKRGKFLSADGMAAFVRDFLWQYDRQSELVEKGGGVYRLMAGKKLMEWLISLPADDQKPYLLSHLHQGGVDVTFESDVAERNRYLTFLHVRHFIIRGIVNEYTKGFGFQHPVARIVLRASGSLHAATYLYLVARATIKAAREQDVLLPVIVNLHTLTALDEEVSEMCLAMMMSEGRDAPLSRAHEASLSSAYGVAEDVLAKRFEERKNEVERVNEAFVNARLASVGEWYRRSIQRIEDRLHEALQKNRKASYVRMLDGQIRKLAAERDRRISEIEALRSVSADFVLIAGGILVVE